MTTVTHAGTEMTYPPAIPAAIPPGLVLVHNHVRRPVRRQGTRGSRYWLQAPADNLEVCGCGWAPEHPAHYRVRRAQST